MENAKVLQITRRTAFKAIVSLPMRSRCRHYGSSYHFFMPCRWLELKHARSCGGHARVSRLKKTVAIGGAVAAG
jgi:hypothetical protein